jgi:putative transposase
MHGVHEQHGLAGDPFAKWTAARPYRRATSRNAAGFLNKVLLNKVLVGMRDSVKAINTGGGPEFMAGFERACAGRNLPLYILPPHSPKLNVGAERCNGAWRYEFYACVEIPGEIKKIAGLVNGFQHLYNYHRPHGALAGATPAQHLKIRLVNKAPLAHLP